MKKKFLVWFITIVVMLSSCNTINSIKKTLSASNNYIEKIQTTSSNLTSKPERIIVKQPKSIGFKPFENEEYISLEDFEFGDYLPMVKLMVPNATRYPSLYDYSILNDVCLDLNDGKELYEDINLKYSLNLNRNHNNYYTSIINDYIGKRRILKISEDGNKVLCATVNDISESYSNDDIFDSEHIFEGIVEIFHGKSLVHTEKISEKGRISECLRDIMSYVHQFTFGLQQTNLNSFYYQPSELFIEQVLEKNLLLIVMGEDFPGDKDESEFYKDGNNINNHDAYIINTDTLDQKYLGSYMFDPMISPDLKYIIYNYPNGEGSSSYFTKANKLKDMPEGFFIKNLETSETTFIPVEEHNIYNSVGWIKRDGLEFLMNNN